MIEIATLVGACGLAVSVLTFFVGRMTAARSTGQKDGQVLTELGYIKKGIDGLDRKMEKMEHEYTKLEVRVAKLEEIVRIYHEGGSI